MKRTIHAAVYVNLRARGQTTGQITGDDQPPTTSEAAL
jgi:hypothetical protein